MKEFAVTSLSLVLKKLAQLTIWRFRPGIVGVTGSVGKTSTKLAIAAVLGTDRHVRVLPGNFNNEIGLALSILGDWKESELELVNLDCPPGMYRFQRGMFWSKVIFISALRLAFGRRVHYPEILILEYGIDRPGDMRRLLEIARPNISVLTAIGETPVHIEFFEGVQELAREKARLIEYLPSAGYAVLNFDDKVLMKLKERTRAQTITYGFDKQAQVRISAFEHRKEAGVPVGVAFKLEYLGTIVPVRLNGSFGKGQAYCAAAAATVGLIFGLNLVKISEGLQAYEPAEGRMSILSGIRESRIIDDAYNTSPLSMRSAIETLKSLPGKRKIAVLGDMAELGKYSQAAHEQIGRVVARVANILVVVGPRAKYIADAARTAGLRSNKIHRYRDASEAKRELPKLIRKGDLILLEASHSMRFEKIVRALQEPNLAPSKN